MTMRISVLTAACAAVLSFSAAAFAGELTSDLAGKFVGSMSDVMTMSEDMRREGKDEVITAAAQPAPGDAVFAPYAKSIAVLKEKFPADYKKLGGLVSKHGFNSAESWATTGDDVMLSYVALKTLESNPQAMASLQAMDNMTPEMLAMMPPEAKAQMEQAKVMMQMVGAVPPANREAVKPFAGEIENWGRESAEKAGMEPAAE